MIIDIENWLAMFMSALKDAFAERVWFVVSFAVLTLYVQNQIGVRSYFLCMIRLLLQLKPSVY